MSEYKQLKTRIWQDNWFLSLNIEEKLLWIFLLTNEYSHISGLYEAPKPLISPLTGIKNWEKILLKFAKDKKIKYVDGWIYIINKEKHQPISQSVRDNVNISIKKYLTENKAILDKMESPLPPPSQTLSELELELELELEDKLKFPLKEKILPLKMTKTDFNTFWDSYPKHVGKKAACGKFMKLPSEKLPLILEAIKRQKTLEQWKNPQFIPHPSTWLNQERWEDQVEQPANIFNNERIL